METKKAIEFFVDTGAEISGAVTGTIIGGAVAGPVWIKFIPSIKNVLYKLGTSHFKC